MILNALKYYWIKRLARMDVENRAKILSDTIRASIEKDDPKQALKFLFRLQNRLYKVESEAAIVYEGAGKHPKHRLTSYHDYFVEHIHMNEMVVDIGCGVGVLAKDIVQRVNGVKVLGLDINHKNIELAKRDCNYPNLEFRYCDASQELPQLKCDVVILSNILEHIEDRVSFLNQIQKQLLPKRILIRVPMSNRDWRVPLKNELGIDSRLSESHFVEFTEEQFLEELKSANLMIQSLQIQWGEIWCEARPVE